MDDEKDLINKICELANQFSWNEIKLELNFTQSGGYGLKAYYFNENDKMINFSIPLRLLRPYIRGLINRYTELKDTKEKFNCIILSLNKNLKLSIDYTFNLENVKTEKINQSNVFYQWLNETMMNRIFDYEKKQGLLTPVLDDDGEFDYYESSWDNGELKFQVNQNKVIHNIILVKNGLSRILNMPLPDYIENALIEHHQITNKELTEEWKPWNTLLIKSPHNDIPYNDWKNYVTYTLDNSIT